MIKIPLNVKYILKNGINGPLCENYSLEERKNFYLENMWAILNNIDAFKTLFTEQEADKLYNENNFLMLYPFFSEKERIKNLEIILQRSTRTKLLCACKFENIEKVLELASKHSEKRLLDIAVNLYRRNGEIFDYDKFVNFITSPLGIVILCVGVFGIVELFSFIDKLVNKSKEDDNVELVKEK